MLGCFHSPYVPLLYCPWNWINIFELCPPFLYLPFKLAIWFRFLKRPMKKYFISILKKKIVLSQEFKWLVQSHTGRKQQDQHLKEGSCILSHHILTTQLPRTMQWQWAMGTNKRKLKLSAWYSTWGSEKTLASQDFPFPICGVHTIPPRNESHLLPSFRVYTFLLRSPVTFTRWAPVYLLICQAIIEPAILSDPSRIWVPKEKQT